jgi:hypothetical protein
LGRRGYPHYEITDDLDLEYSKIKDLGNLISVGGHLYLRYSEIESLGNLTSVGGNLDLHRCNIESLGNLTSVGGYLNLGSTPLTEKYTKNEIQSMVKVGGRIYY